MDNFTPNDVPISEKAKDALQVTPRVVNRILNLLGNEQISTLTLAVTGEWGVGKSSVMNLLTAELNDSAKNVIIHFEPLLEGKFEVIEILQLFYLKLYSTLNAKELEVDSIFRKLLTSLGVLVFNGSTLSVGIPNVASASVDFDKKIEGLLNVWKGNDIESFSKQTAELNAFLKKESLRVFIFIDEIDRLPSEHIINFLLFARVLETIENLICIVGIDYEQVNQSLRASRKYSAVTYDQARAYLDKLFHARFHVSHNESTLVEFATKKLKSIDEKSFSSVIESSEYKTRDAFALIIEYLKTPRQIKKWLTSLVVNKPIIDGYPGDLIYILMLSAICVRHPIILGNLAKHTLPMLSSEERFPLFIKNKYGSDLFFKSSNENKKEGLILQSSGLIQVNDEETHLKLPIEYICDRAAYRMLKKVIKTNKISWILLFIEGYADENKVKIYRELLDGEVNKAIEWILDNPTQADIIVSDLSMVLAKQQVIPKQSAKIGLLNKLWQRTINPDDFLNTPRYKKLFFCMYKHSAEDMLKSAGLSLLEFYLEEVLSVFGIKGSLPQGFELSQFSIDEFKNSSWRSEKHAVSEITYNQIPISDFEQSTIKELLEDWVSRVESDFSDDFDSVIENENRLLIKVFYRYIQWAKAVDHSDDKREKLTQYVQKYFDGQEVDLCKKLNLANIIFHSCGPHQTLTKDNNAMIDLFNKDIRLINTLNEVAKKARPDMSNYKAFKGSYEYFKAFIGNN